MKMSYGHRKTLISQPCSPSMQSYKSTVDMSLRLAVKMLFEKGYYWCISNKEMAIGLKWNNQKGFSKNILKKLTVSTAGKIKNIGRIDGKTI